MTTTYSVKSN